MARPDLRETEALLVLRVRTDCPDLKDPLDSTASPDSRALQANAVPTDCRALTARQEPLVLRATLDPPVVRALPARPALPDATDSPALRDFRDRRASRVLLGRLLG